jgi:hypothetical protein
VPDEAHTVVTAGYGTFADSGASGDNDYLTAGAHARRRAGDGVHADPPHHHRGDVGSRRSRRRVVVRPERRDRSADRRLAVRQQRPARLHAAGQQRRRRRDLGAVPGSERAATGQRGAFRTERLVGPSIGARDVTLTWAHSTDNVAVAGYRVYRDGALEQPLRRRRTTDADLAPLTHYAFAVAAYDYANNVSACRCRSRSRPPAPGPRSCSRALRRRSRRRAPSPRPTNRISRRVTRTSSPSAGTT